MAVPSSRAQAGRGVAGPFPQRVVRLASETDLAGWREAARTLRAEGVAPEQVIWTVDGAGAPERPACAKGGEAAAFTVPRAFLDLAAKVVLHRSPERFDLLYRLLWRLAAAPHLLHVGADSDVARARDFARAVDRAAHKLKAFVRFRPVAGETPETFVAWFEPAHRVTGLAAPFFARRFAAQRFSLLTPDACLHWDGRTLATTPGADAADAPAQDDLEDFWRRHYLHAFTPSRSENAAPMAARPPADPDRRSVRAARRQARDAPFDGAASSSLAEVTAGVQVCRRCELWRDATQGVAGEGPPQARLMLVGEQPGDQEDLAGRPFVGPAGQVLDRALAAAGVARGDAYVTNAVKHFKHELRGKRRLHKTPDAGEVGACRWWLDNERRIVRPRVVAALGATAALAVFGRPTPIGKARGQVFQLPDQSQGVVTYHPSYLLRLPDAAEKKKAFEAFVEDLAFAWSLTR